MLSTLSETGARITATNDAAEARGLFVGMALTDARAMHPAFDVAVADPAGDEEALHKLSSWSRRYSPLTRADVPDGLMLDITGCAHLFGGEAALIEDMRMRLEGFELSPAFAIAPSIGAAWALARYGKGTCTIVGSDNLKAHLKPLPVAALRIEDSVRLALIKVGLKRIGDLLGKPRAPLATRFGRALVLRLGQALDEDSEAFHAQSPLPLYRTAQRFAEPVVTLADIEQVIGHLTRELAEALHKAGKGARRLELMLFHMDGGVEVLHVRTSTTSHDGTHFARLFGERLDQIKDCTGFGFELMALCAFDTELASAHQHVFENESAAPEESSIAPLLDRLINRFGPRSVTRFCPRASYIPEQATGSVSVLHPASRDIPVNWAAHTHAVYDDTPFGRPLLLFAAPEPITVLVEMPDNPPERFEWRRVSHRVTRAEGAERLAPEWWRAAERQGSKPVPRTRDYYRVEDESGHRFWLYREGLYDRVDDAPRWFIHGLFT